MYIGDRNTQAGQDLAGAVFKGDLIFWVNKNSNPVELARNIATTYIVYLAITIVMYQKLLLPLLMYQYSCIDNFDVL